MTGLIYKDILLSVKTLKAYVSVMLFYGVMTFLGIFDISFVTSFLSILLIVLPLGAFSYDEVAKWDQYAMALPLGRRAVVGARYLFALCIVLFSLALSFLFSAGAAALGLNSFIEPLATTIGTMGFGLMAIDILLPLCYKLGPERARPYLYAVIFLPIVAMFLAFRAGVHVDLSWLDQLVLESPLLAIGAIALIPLAGLAFMAPSYLISCRVVDRKEF